MIATQLATGIEPVEPPNATSHYTDFGDGAHLPGRMVLSPSAGEWSPGVFGDLQRWDAGPVVAGDVLGSIGGDDIVSPIAGRLAAVLVLAGERLRIGEPIAWVVPT